MPLKDDTQIQVTKHLLVLERGLDELLLSNMLHASHLYIPNGREYIKNFLKEAEKLGSVGSIKEKFPQDIPLLEVLIAHKIFIVDPQMDHVDCKKKSFSEQLDKNLSSISLYLLLTQSCNCACVYCYNGCKTYKTQENLQMPEEVAYKSIDVHLKNLAPNGCLEVIFFGGEPLLNWPLAKKIIEYCENLKRNGLNKQIRYHLTSNLSLMPPDLIEWIQKYRITVLCDLDGPADIHNIQRPFKSGKPSYEDIIKNIKCLREAGIEVSLRATITAFSEDRIQDVAMHLKDLGCTIAICYVNPANSDGEFLPDSMLPSPEKVVEGLRKVYRDKICDVGAIYPYNMFIHNLAPNSFIPVGCGTPTGSTPVVDASGDVYACIYLVGIKKFYLGNVRDDHYPDKKVLECLWNSLQVDNLEDCKSCIWRYRCAGGCPMLRFTVYENPLAGENTRAYSKKMNCLYLKTVMEDLMWELAERAGKSAQEQKETVLLKNSYC